MPTLIDAEIVQRNAQPFACLDQKRMRGGYRSVADAAARDAIPVDMLFAGMVVYTIADGKEWRLADDGVNWTQISGPGVAGMWLSQTSMAVGANVDRMRIYQVPAGRGAMVELRIVARRASDGAFASWNLHCSVTDNGNGSISIVENQAQTDGVEAFANGGDLFTLDVDTQGMYLRTNLTPDSGSVSWRTEVRVTENA